MVGKPEHPIQVIGTRHGEKLFEALLSREEMACAEDKGDYYRIPPDLRDLNYSKFVEQGKKKSLARKTTTLITPRGGCGRHATAAAQT
ncbi:polysaccharide biosynthesis protein [Ditylenchus destructor]|nr:polysaccharide biosynthesis protein [Ditylenchus destructor]